MAKVLKAKQVLTLMRRADPANALKLTDPSEYEEIPVQDFFTQMEGMDFSNKELEQLNRLREEITCFKANSDKFHFHENKLYIYFILRLQEILGV